MATDDDKQAERDEMQWTMGNRAAYRSILAACLRELEIDDPLREVARLKAERIDAIAALRRICEQHGDNGWKDDLYLADIIEKTPSQAPRGVTMDKELIERLAREALTFNPETGEFRRRADGLRTKAGDVAGTPNNDGYLTIRIGASTVALHRLAWLFHHGAWPLGQIDHINGNPADNRIANLRECTPVQNQWNAKPRANTSGHKGVTQHRDQWQARIRVNTKIVHLGTYAQREVASKAYDEAAKLLAGEFAYTNRELVAAIRSKFSKG